MSLLWQSYTGKQTFRPDPEAILKMGNPWKHGNQSVHSYALGDKSSPSMCTPHPPFARFYLRNATEAAYVLIETPA